MQSKISNLPSLFLGTRKLDDFHHRLQAVMDANCTKKRILLVQANPVLFDKSAAPGKTTLLKSVVFDGRLVLRLVSIVSVLLIYYAVSRFSVAVIPLRPISRFSFLVSRSSFLVSRFSFLVSRFSFLVSRFSFLVSRFSFLVSRFSFLVSRFSFLVSRFSFLVSRWQCDRAITKVKKTLAV